MAGLEGPVAEWGDIGLKDMSKRTMGENLVEHAFAERANAPSAPGALHFDGRGAGRR